MDPRSPQLKASTLEGKDQDPRSREGSASEARVPQSRSREIAFTALCIALIAVSSWITIPIGPVPITLQMFAIPFVMEILKPKQATIAIFAFVIMGAIGIPVFSGMRGGFGILLGPTGGFLWGYLIGVPAGAYLLHFLRRIGWNPFVSGVIGGVVFTAFAYLGGWLQFMAISSVGPWAAFLATVAPFIVMDLVKVVVATMAAQGVRAALGSTSLSKL